jgi:hypothetical protein
MWQREKDGPSLQVIQRFVNDRANLLQELLKEDLPLFETKNGK